MQKAFQFRGKQNLTVALVKIQRLFAHPVTRQNQTLAIIVPERKSKHSAQVIDKIRLVFLVKMQNDFAVRLASKFVPRSFQAVSEFDVVINLAVDDEGERFVF